MLSQGGRKYWERGEGHTQNKTGHEFTFNHYLLHFPANVIPGNFPRIFRVEVKKELRTSHEMQLFKAQ